MSITPDDVYIGIWTDWSKGSQVFGSTITITSSASILLTAFLALYVSLSVSYLWLLIAYSIHRARYKATTGKCRAIVRQQQAIIRAGLTPTSTSIRLIKLYWTYRSTPAAWRESWIWIMVSVLCAVSSAASGVFSSQIIDSSANINVLLNSPNCGFFMPDGADVLKIDDPKLVAQRKVLLDTLNLAIAYSRRCYNATSDNSLCKTFSSATIPWNTGWEAKCPFGNMCMGSAMRLDTGLINSNSIMGLNSPIIDQVELRKITTCAPIVQKGYTALESTIPSDGLLPGDQLVTYLYGPASYANATWGISLYAANTTQSYTMAVQSYYSGAWSVGGWLPDPEFNNTQGDGTIFFLSSNDLQFTEPCDDPIFSAHVQGSRRNGNTVFLEDHTAGVLGCLEQFQWCSPVNGKCSDVGGRGDVHIQVTEQMSLNTMQIATADMVDFVLDTSSLMAIVASHNPPNLVASQSVITNLQLPLPSNQWQIEVQDWHATVLTALQYGILQWMIGPSDATLQKYVEAPKSPEQRALCRRQRVHISQGLANVSSFGLFFTVGLGAVIILVALFLDNVIACATRFTKGSGEKHRAWIRSDVLHLQRLANVQQPSYGSRWAGADNNIPFVEGNGFLDPLVDPHNVQALEGSNGDANGRLSVDSLLHVYIGS
ncbi:hypothetical protein F5Y19DRAFT_488512 [Xylariaceae sp. FL1651]|nr:hypothetical protein F5Y19DRAFT_488512 [Xylariaceae sp. FL1651]